MIKTIRQVMEENKSFKSKSQVIGNWKDFIPAGSRWHPGDPGNPACKICEGTGYLRLDLSLSHPDFGKLVLCECASAMPAQRSTMSRLESGQ
jgi:hypothetical protein